MAPHSIVVALYLSLTWICAPAAPSGNRVAIINTVPWHEELYPAFHYAWQRAGFRPDTFVHRRANTMGLTEITQSWNFNPIYIPGDEFHPSPTFLRRYDALLILNAEWESNLYEELRNLSLGSGVMEQHMQVYLVYHGCEDCEKDFNVEELPKLFVRFLELFPSAKVLTLAPHAAQYIRDVLLWSGFKHSVDYFVPIFPVDLAPPSNHSGFVLQGYVDLAVRRNYSGVIKSMAAVQPPYVANMTLRVLGYNTAKLSRFQSPILMLADGVSYPEYYSYIQGALGLLTAFADRRYLTTKASSSVAASLICGTPLLTEVDTLRSYTFLSPDSVWIRRLDEPFAATLRRIATMPDLHAQYLRRRRSLQRDIRRIHARNNLLVLGTMQRSNSRASEKARTALLRGLRNPN